jgi:hypothetical protein
MLPLPRRRPPHPRTRSLLQHRRLLHAHLPPRLPRLVAQDSSCVIDPFRSGNHLAQLLIPSWRELRHTPSSLIAGVQLTEFPTHSIRCTQRYAKKLLLPTRKVGIREFCENLAIFLLEAEEPVAITRHGDTVGYYIPTRRGRTEAERASLKEAVARLQAMMAAQGISEEEVARDFRQWRSGRRK